MHDDSTAPYAGCRESFCTFQKCPHGAIVELMAQGIATGSLRYAGG
jgi:hypothetical protein